MKKKTIAAFGFFAVSAVLILLTSSAPANAQLLDPSYSLNTLASYLKTPHDIAHYIWRHFSFETDRRQFGENERIQTAEELLLNKRGDCEDFARFAYEILKLKGKRPMILNLYGKKYAHSVCLFKENGGYYVIDGKETHRFETMHLNKIAKHLYPFWEKGILLSPEKQKIIGVFHA